MKINLIGGAFLPIPPERGGGIEIFIYNLAKELAKKHNVIIYTKKEKNQKDNEIIENIKIIRIPGYEKTGNKITDQIKIALYSLKVLKKLRKADINHFFDFQPLLITPFKIKNSIFEAQYVFKFPLSKIIQKRCSKIVTISEYAKKYFIKQAKFNTKNIAIIPNAVDNKVYHPIKKNLELINKYKLKNKKVISFIGRVHEDKGIIYLLKAFNELIKNRKDCKLMIVGPYKNENYAQEKYYNKLKEYVTNNNLDDKVIFTGLINPKELPQYYNLSDIIVFPHIWDEPFGIVCIEAMACKKPLIITPSGAFNEIAEDNKDALFVPKKNSEKIKEKIEYLLNNKKERDRLSKNALIRSKDYSYEKIAKEYEKLYREIK